MKGGSVYQCGICLGWTHNPVRCVHCKAIFQLDEDRWVVDPYLTADIPKDKVFSDTDKINPQHYRSHPSKIECIEITRHHNFNIGNAIKYLWRQGLKDSSPALEDLKKAAWYINDEIKRIENGNTTKTD